MKKTVALFLVMTVIISSIVCGGTSVYAEIGEKGSTVARQMNDEGIVLLKNDNNALPLANGEKIVVFGEAQANLYDKSVDTLTVQRGYIPFGAGSARSINDEKAVAPLDAFRQGASDGKIVLFEDISKQYESNPDYYPTDAEIDSAAAFGDTAIIFISRWGGECRDFKKADWSLTEKEQSLIKTLRAKFKKVVAVLNTGNAIDTSWDTDVDALLFACYGGFQGGSGIFDILSGAVNPSGKLTSTWATALDAYPTNDAFFSSTTQKYTEDIFLGYRYFETFDKEYSKVKYPFGYGLSYTQFEISSEFTDNGDKVTVSATVKNIGNTAGKEVVQVYCKKPEGKLPQASAVLCGFDKTNTLQPDEVQTLTIEISKNDLASYDDVGKTGNTAAYVLEAGSYGFFVGNSVKNAGENNVGSFSVEELQITKQLTTQSVTKLDKRLTSDGTLETIPKLTKTASSATEATEAVQEPADKDTYYKLFDVLNGKVTLDEFVAQMKSSELATFFVSYAGNKAGASLEVCGKYGISQFKMSDSSQGIGSGSTSYPCETIMASTWNLRLAAAYALSIASEAYTSSIDMILSPAVNLQRHPLSGRNFEYYSEDPFISGKFAETVIENIQSMGVGACIKHFVCNEIEASKLSSDSRVSERALRELYLLPFQMAVENSKPWGIMSSYNIVNGVPVSENGDLLINIVRKEWGFEGFITGDWNNDKDAVKEINNGNNVREPASNCDINKIITAIQNGKISRDVLENGAKQVLYVIMRTHSYSVNNLMCANSHTFENNVCTKCYFLDKTVLEQLPTQIQALLDDIPTEDTVNIIDAEDAKSNTLIFVIVGAAALCVCVAICLILKKIRKITKKDN